MHCAQPTQTQMFRVLLTKLFQTLSNTQANSVNVFQSSGSSGSSISPFVIIVNISISLKVPYCPPLQKTSPDFSIQNSSSEKVLGVVIDKNLNLNEQVTSLCNKSSNKIQALPQIFSYMSITQRKLLVNAYFLSQFGYYLLVWMNCSKILKNCINRPQEKAHRFVYSNFISTFSEFLTKNKLMTINRQSLQTRNNFAPETMKNVFYFETLS